MTKILFVDDDANLLVSYHRSLRKRFEIDTALGGEVALGKLASNGPYSVIISDMAMPDMNGIEFLAKSRKVAPDSVRIMLTGNADLKTAMEAVNCGNIFRFLLKPCLPDDLAANIDVGVEQYRLIHSEKELLEKTLHGSIRMLIEVLALASPELFDRAQSMRTRMLDLAEAVGVHDVWKMELVALLSQIGVIALPASILQKQRSGQKLTADEASIAKRIHQVSHNLIVKIPRLEGVAEAIRYGDKNYDGSGSPEDGVSEDNIPMGARLLKILTDLTEIQHSGVTDAGAIGMMRRRTGVYDPKILDTCEALFGAAQRRRPLIQTGKATAAEDLAAGMQLTSDIETKCGLLLVSSGHVLTDAVLERVRNFAELSGLKEPIFVDFKPS